MWNIKLVGNVEISVSKVAFRISFSTLLQSTMLLGSGHTCRAAGLIWRFVQEFRSSLVSFGRPTSMELVRTWVVRPGLGSLQETARLLKGPGEKRELDW